MNKYCLLLLLSATLVSCTPSAKDPLTYALEQAGAHRAELESVLEHYRNEPLKRKAAEFLISNMPGRYTLEGPFLDRYYELLDSIQAHPGLYPEDIRAFYNSIYKNPQWQTLTKVYDLQTIKADYLIEHIDVAFEAWQSPWAKKLTFEDFCEYLLPYRVGNERLEPWMHNLREKYRTLLEETDNIDSLYTRISNQYVGFRYYTPSYVPDCRPSSLQGIRVGSCRSYGSLALYIFRSLGVPIVREFTPNWSNHAMGHEWTNIRINGKNHPILLGDGDALGEHVEKFIYRLSKVYRECFGSYRPQITDDEDAPPLFRSPKLRDITDEYTSTGEVIIKNAFPLKGKRLRHAYLTVYNRHTWKTVAFGKREGKGFRFEEISLNAVYLPVYCVKGQYIPAYHPILIDSTGTYTPLIADTTRRQNVILQSKFMDLKPKIWAKAMLGGCFVFGKDIRFTRTDTVWIDTLRTFGFQTLAIEGTYRCMKYVPPQRTEGNIGEIELYDKEGKLVEGRVTGNYSPPHIDPMKSMQRAFDGAVLSYAVAGPEQTDAWLGLDFGRMVELKELAFLTRSDDNFIREGEEYELYYWDNGWQSLGKRTGSRKLQYLTYNNVPANALLLLRNLTKGKEERIFTYEDGKQVWW